MLAKAKSGLLARAVSPGTCASSSGLARMAKSGCPLSSAYCVSRAIDVAPMPRFGVLITRSRLTVSSGL